VRDSCFLHIDITPGHCGDGWTCHHSTC